MAKQQPLEVIGSKPIISSDEVITRIRGQAFFARHGGRLTRELCSGKAASGRSGWWEAGAADGYKLRCEWFRTADEEQLKFSEIGPA
jgi:hypothetical protein